MNFFVNCRILFPLTAIKMCADEQTASTLRHFVHIVM